MNVFSPTVGTIDEKVFITSDEAFSNVLNNLESHYGAKPHLHLIREKAGSNNNCALYQARFGNTNINIALRVSTQPIFKKERSGGLDLYILTIGQHDSVRRQSGMKTVSYEKLKKDETQSRINWVKAAEKDLSPELFFYGYVSKNDKLHMCVISRGFDSDVDTYYENEYTRMHPSARIEIDNHIRNQFTSLFDKMATPEKRGGLGLICFDIKPLNTVILENSGTIKLIDWDSDFCRPFKYLKSRELGDNMPEFTSVLMQCVMAVHFFVHFDNNIFAEYFKTNRRVYDILTTHKASLKSLFCDQNVDYAELAEYYFQIHTDSCDSLWEQMYIRLFSKNKQEMNQININKDNKNHDYNFRKRGKSSQKSKHTNKKLPKHKLARYFKMYNHTKKGKKKKTKRKTKRKK